MASQVAPLKRVIGIGASAGGLDGFLSLFSSLPVMPDTAVVIAQHMARDEHAHLVLNLLNREGLWPAVIPANGTALQPGTIYLLPAEQDGVIREGVICLEQPSEDSYSSPSVNRLFRSLAVLYREKSLGVILSGAGSDGATGCRAIKQSGGQVWVQSPGDAAYNSMPLSATEAVSADFIGTVPEIACQLDQLAHPDLLSGDAIPSDTVHTTCDIALNDKAKSSAQNKSPGFDPSNTDDQSELEQITSLIFEHTGIDFAGYKRETLLRRLDKRKSQVCGLQDLAAGNQRYLTYLQQHPSELEILEQCLLVSVSSFFRDAEVYQSLRAVLAKLITGKRDLVASGKDAGVFRILVAGCATGEEAYSLMILCRLLELTLPVELTAIDLNREAIHAAEKGIYHPRKLTELPEDLLERYFEPAGDDYRIRETLKDKIHFIQGDIFTQHFDHRFDLVSCRNLMIYLKREQQDQLIDHLYYHMQDHSVLVIGMTESLSPAGQKLFSTTDYFHRIFERRKA